jgi:hypothetical protein
VLEVVQDQQQAPAGKVLDDVVGDRPAAGLAYVQCVGDGRPHERRIGQRREVDEPDPVRNVERERRGGRDRQSGLADATGAGQGEQPHLLLAEQGEGQTDLVLASDQSRRLGRQVGGRLSHEADPSPALTGR